MTSRESAHGVRGAVATVRETFRTERLILAGKAAAAASVAWMLAPSVPFADAEYSYYAPLGVLVSMYPTVAGSARAGVQSLIGLGVGVALGLGVLGLVFAGLPSVIAVAVVIGVGILIGGIPALGEGRDWVAIAGLFVLLLGGLRAEEFSASYLLTMAFGVLIGVLTNLLIFPPLYLQRASQRLSTLRDAVCASLREIADALEDDADGQERMPQAVDGLEEMLPSVSSEVEMAEESSRANPRSRTRAAERRLNGQRMAALERTTRATIDLADALAAAAAEGALADSASRGRLAAAVRASADIVEAPASDDGAAERLAAAERALDDAAGTLGRHPSRDGAPYAFADSASALLCVRRIVEASREFVAATG